MTCHPARARKLLQSGRARVHRLGPLAIRWVDRAAAQSEGAGVEVGIDPGGEAAGIWVFRATAAGGVGLVEVQPRGQLIHKRMGQRGARRRLSNHLRRRPPRFDNRTRSDGWLAPGTRQLVGSTMAIVARPRRRAPVIPQELVRSDTQQMGNPEISGVGYQQGEPPQVREHPLERWGRTCAHWGASGVGSDPVPPDIDRIHPRAEGGTDRVSNLILARIPCNRAEGSRSAAGFLAHDPARLARILARAKAPLRDAAAGNATRLALGRSLAATGQPVSPGSGGRPKWNRSRFSVTGSHPLDALRGYDVEGVVSRPNQMTVAASTGRGAHQRANPDKHGFTKGHHRLPGRERIPSEGTSRAPGRASGSGRVSLFGPPSRSARRPVSIRERGRPFDRELQHPRQGWPCPGDLIQAPLHRPASRRLGVVAP